MEADELPADVMWRHARAGSQLDGNVHQDDVTRSHVTRALLLIMLWRVRMCNSRYFFHHQFLSDTTVVLPRRKVTPVLPVSCLLLTDT